MHLLLGYLDPTAGSLNPNMVTTKWLKDIHHDHDKPEMHDFIVENENELYKPR